eukprot:651215-Pelagomonas_calceolata.AAC.2
MRSNSSSSSGCTAVHSSGSGSCVKHHRGGLAYMKEGKRLRKPNGRVHQGRKFSLTSQLARASPKAGWSALRAVGAAAGGHRSIIAGHAAEARNATQARSVIAGHAAEATNAMQARCIIGCMRLTHKRKQARSVIACMLC